MKNQIILLRIAGSICFIFTLFHFAFSTLFNWDQSLNCLSQSDRAILLTYHYISILILSFMTIVLILQPKALLESKVRISVLGLFMLFYVIRIITEFTQFGIEMPRSAIIISMCVLPTVLCGIPLFYKYK